MAQTLGDIKALLAERGLYPKKKFGQNFLHDAHHMEAILAAAQLSPGDRVLEVGPGTGALTERLLDAGARVLAVEVDSDLEPILRERCGEDHAGPLPHGRGSLQDSDAGQRRFELIIGDALDAKHAIRAEVVERLRGEPFKLIANLPYQVASPLLANTATQLPTMRGAVVMVQREVADRLAAAPGGKNYGPLGVLIQAAFEVSRVGVLKPGSFWPAPKVDSAVVQLVRRSEPLCEDLASLSQTAGLLFGKRRKQLGGILGRDFPLPQGLEPTARPEVLTISQIAEIAAQMRPSPHDASS